MAVRAPAKLEMKHAGFEDFNADKRPGYALLYRPRLATPAHTPHFYVSGCIHQQAKLGILNSTKRAEVFNLNLNEACRRVRRLRPGITPPPQDFAIIETHAKVRDLSRLHTAEFAPEGGAVNPKCRVRCDQKVVGYQ